MDTQELDQRLRDIQREYVDFLDDEVSLFLTNVRIRLTTLFVDHTIGRPRKICSTC